MTRDRCDYRTMSTDELLDIGRREGVDEELAIAALERLARRAYGRPDAGFGNFHWRKA